jgi:hypothetical protein
VKVGLSLCGMEPVVRNARARARARARGSFADVWLRAQAVEFGRSAASERERMVQTEARDVHTAIQRRTV